MNIPTTYTFQLYANYPPSQNQPGPFIAQNVNRVFSITVNPAPTLSSNLPAGQVSVPYGAAFSAIGGTGPFIYSYSGNLPPGLSLNPQGQLSGTPQLGGNYSFTVNARDVNGALATVQASLLITGSLGSDYFAELSGRAGCPELLGSAHGDGWNGAVHLVNICRRVRRRRGSPYRGPAYRAFRIRWGLTYLSCAWWIARG